MLMQFETRTVNLVACEVRETPVTLRSIECIHRRACTPVSFYDSEDGPRPSDVQKSRRINAVMRKQSANLTSRD